MTDRNKLSGLLYEASRKADSESYIFDQIADYLIANGVTVQEWISVKDRLPDNKEMIGMKKHMGGFLNTMVHLL